MWWLYSKRSENESHIEYAYSRGSRSLDGLIRIDRSGRNVQLVRACDADDHTPHSGDDALEFAYVLYNENFPIERQVACG